MNAILTESERCGLIIRQFMELNSSIVIFSVIAIAMLVLNPIPVIISVGVVLILYYAIYKLINKKFGNAGKEVTQYLNSYHGLASMRGGNNAALCIDCHGVHSILSKSDSVSTVNASNVTTTCRKCHIKASETFAKSSEKPVEIKIMLKLLPKQLLFTVENPFNPQIKPVISTEKGLANLKSRLRFYYPQENYQLNLKKNSNLWVSELYLPSNSND